jgi:hypothetical protein
MDESRGEKELVGKDPEPLEICMSIELTGQIKDAVLAHFGGDENVLGLVDCLEAGFTKRSELAECLGTDVKEIDNAKKRLRRKLESELKL